MTVTIPLAPGTFVHHPHRPDWGLGQVQSVIGHRVTVNFEGAGKVVIMSDRVALEPDDPPNGGNERSKD